MKLLNIGCGSRHHPDWINMDVKPRSPDVLEGDPVRGLALDDRSMDAVYASHVVEHFTRHDSLTAVREFLRVLRPGGVLRVAVPDFEIMARLYLDLLDRAIAGDRTAQERYEWIVVEMFDQMVRTVPGGEMLEYWARDPLPAGDFVLDRCGQEAANAVAMLRRRGHVPAPRPRTAEELGAFRLSGEVHQWMYDRHSLSGLLLRAGFAAPRVVRADESAIPGFAGYDLDTDASGAVRKPDSLFMEAVRPEE
ncbi:class I SAM-dependent methyltransferase [Pseudodesulfovibrio tunisiensis]|uniref:class I SAM-dependent methyltransferase n=1 Tax=Pseudodesulfovibrio tunisiensis TaxID=463192 RepID=UPI001FB49A63|nr:methyltransferase domain-containing protein [Pseudodesulfovibrio tunisiensis]